MAFVARCGKGHSLSACYLLISTVLVMFTVYALEQVALGSKCCGRSPDRIGVFLNIGKTRPLFYRPPLDRLEETPVVDVEDSNDKISEAEGNVGVSGAEFNVVNVSEGDLNKTVGTDEVILNISEDDKLLDRNASNIETEKKPEEEKVQISSTSGPPVVRSVWYYTRVYKHPVAKLRLLTDVDGVPTLLSSRPPPEREITIVTQTSADRLPALEATCSTWGGAICIAVHVRLQSEFASVYDRVRQLFDRMEEQSRCRLNIQLVTEDGFETEEDALKASYPVNALRNVALGMAKTKLIFLLDADFKPSPRLHESLTEEETYKDLLRKATEERKLFVVPAFETAPVKGRPANVTVPESMEELREGWENKTIHCFHCMQSPTGHIPTQFEIFFDPATTSPYPVTYKYGYEPYVIGARDVIPSYDARFRGYGENKISQIYASAADGMGFIVLPNVFVYELPHPPSRARESYTGKHRDPDQRYRILGLYSQFRQDIERIQKEKDPARYQEFLSSSDNGRK